MSHISQLVDQNSELQGLINSGMNHLLPQALDHIEYYNNYSVTKWARIKEINDQIGIFSEQACRRGYISKDDIDRVFACSYKLLQELKELQDFNFSVMQYQSVPVLPQHSYPLPMKESQPINPLNQTYLSSPVLLPNEFTTSGLQKKKIYKKKRTYTFK